MEPPESSLTSRLFSTHTTSQLRISKQSAFAIHDLQKPPNANNDVIYEADNPHRQTLDLQWNIIIRSQRDSRWSINQPSPQSPTMPHATSTEKPKPIESKRSPNTKASSSRELRQLQILHDQTKEHYVGSHLSISIAKLLDSKTRPKITKIVSLGLGSLKSTDQPRRIKQLTIFLAIAEQLREHEAKLEIFAQDPSFNKTDEVFLQSLGVRILSTPAVTELGEAARYIDASTLVYSPFLTLEAYQLLFSTETFKFFVGDDFDALRIKWPKHSAGRNEAETLSRSVAQGFRKRVIAGDGFWEEEDKPFPMAMYSSGAQRPQIRQHKSKL